MYENLIRRGFITLAPCPSLLGLPEDEDYGIGDPELIVALYGVGSFIRSRCNALTSPVSILFPTRNNLLGTVIRKITYRPGTRNDNPSLSCQVGIFTAARFDV